jgi:AcrR family transcriptional regulator
MTTVRSGGTGPKRNPRAHQAILDATVEVLADVGYSRLTIERVAASAGVGKATVYRWWSSKGHLVGEALAKHLDVTPVPDLGNTRAELIVGLSATVRNYGGPVGGIELTALAADLRADAELMEAFRREFLKPRRAVITEVFGRAVARGDIPAGINDDLVQDIFAGTIFYRHLMSGLSLTDGIVADLVDLVIEGRLPLVEGASNAETGLQQDDEERDGIGREPGQPVRLA